MLENFPFYLGLVVIILLLVMLAKRLQVAYPVLLVVAGLLISFVPGLPQLHIDPELIFIIFLPPLLFDAAWAISWKELWRWRRVISSFAFPVVFLSALAVALVANHFIPGFSLALGFVLGGIVSPPDAVSAGAILKFVKVPKRMSSILEGESLLNDASSLIIFRFSLIAVATGQFIWQEAALSFCWMVLGGVGIGLLVAFLFMKTHKLFPTEPQMDIVLTIVAPYVMYIAAEEMYSSGVLAVVSGGLLLSNKRHLFLNSSSRIRSASVWESLTFVMNGLVFMFIGLELPDITNSLGNISLSEAIGYGLLITAVLIIGRMIATYGAVVITLIARNFITVADGSPGFRVPLIMGWAGMRGVVSLAAALSIPVEMDSGTAFPQRSLILFITFIVILVTLLMQGLTLPYLIRKIKLPHYTDLLPEEETDRHIRQQFAALALEHLRNTYGAAWDSDPVFEYMARKWERLSGSEQDFEWQQSHGKIHQEIIHQQRRWLLSHNHEHSNVDEDIVRRHLHYLDIEEEKIKAAAYR